MTFPDKFRWGTTSSATQVEGAANHSDWFRWENLGNAPRSAIGNEFSTLYDEDFAILAEHGLTNHMLTLDWARLEPTRGHVDHDAVEHYTEILRSARSRGIEVWGCLHHFTLPGWFSDDAGGFSDDRARCYDWALHVDRTAEMFGELVTGFVPIYEPLTFAYRAFLAGTFPPGRQNIEDFTTALRATYLANSEAWRLLRSGTQPVMTVHGLSPVYPGTTSRHPDERDAACEKARFVHSFIWDSWIVALREGILAIPGQPPEEVPSLADAFDLIGFTYQDALTVRADMTTLPYPEDLQAGPTGQGPWPEGLGVTIRRLADDLPGRKFLVAGCRLTSSKDDLEDQARVNYLDSCVKITSDAIDDGIDIQGFFHGGAMDGYEWHLGTDAYSGLFDSTRNARNSALTLRNWATMSR